MKSIDDVKQFWNSVFEYRDGNLYWKENSANRNNKGKLAGYLSGAKYYQVRLNGVAYYVHRVIYEMHFGETKSEIDHINRDKLDNRVENLREASRSQNICNNPARSDNKLGIKGVCFHKATGKYNAQININGKRKSLGFFKTIEEAKEKYLEYETLIHKDFAGSNII
jgi:hypothetical protein